VSGDSVPTESMAIAVRAYVRKQHERVASQTSKNKVTPPSEWVLIFDTETSTDAAQSLRFGTYQVREMETLFESGIFYQPEMLSKGEIKTLMAYGAAHRLKVINVREFIDDVFYKFGYHCRATIVGFNLPFDISRLASEHATARSSQWNKIMRGGFTFKLSESEFNPRVQVKQVSMKNSFIQFAAPKGQRATRGDRKKKRKQPVRRGFFIDIKTLAAALTSRSHSLASLAQMLRVDAQKQDTQDHGRKLTPEYIAYAVQDTQTTWECYSRLKVMYETHGLQLTEAHNIHSEASLGKAYLREMGIKPWRHFQADFPAELLGKIMSTYYGGRSEIHIRLQPVQVLYCDFLSMYPTVCTLMGLWRFVIAQGMAWHDTTAQTREFLARVDIADLQKQETWQSLATIVQVLPDRDIFPVRAKYGGDDQYTIGSNYLTSEAPLYYTLADCISAKLLSGKAPHILQATSFTPGPMQENLSPVKIAGNAAYMVDPCKGDFFKRVIDLRSEVKRKIKDAKPCERDALETQQLALKIIANATSYGIFVELNIEQEKLLQELLCFGPSGQGIPLQKKKFEATGSFFHPLLAALITGAARLMLAITERMAIDSGIDWAFCDTDSMALAKPEGMGQKEFYRRAQSVQEWFTPLNPYAQKAPLLKIEDYNYSQSAKGELEPLYCYAISSKRYALFNIDASGKTILRKVSAHGLGHLLPPYSRSSQANLEDAQPWQQDLWLEIINAAREDRHPDYSNLENFDHPAVSRYGASTPELAGWFNDYNARKHYSKQVRPFNFLLAFQTKSGLRNVRPVATYTKNLTQAAAKAFDRKTGKAVRRSTLKTYLEAIAQYHLHPETKFLNGDFTDSGRTQRRHIVVKSIQHIGKEANKWEEQFYLGLNPEAQIEYGICPEQKNAIMQGILSAISAHGAKRMADAARLSERQVLRIGLGKAAPSENAMAKLQVAAKKLDSTATTEQELRRKVKNLMREKKISIRSLAAKLKIDPSNLAKVLSGGRNAGDLLVRASDSLAGH
jgi:hypothetical protein